MGRKCSPYRGQEGKDTDDERYPGRGIDPKRSLGHRFTCAHGLAYAHSTPTERTASDLWGVFGSGGISLSPLECDSVEWPVDREDVVEADRVVDRSVG